MMQERDGSDLSICTFVNTINLVWFYILIFVSIHITYRSRKVSTSVTVVTEHRRRNEVTDDDEHRFENGRYGVAKILRSNIVIIVTCI